MVIEYKVLGEQDADHAAELRIQLLMEVAEKPIQEDYGEKIRKAVLRNLWDGSGLAMAAYAGDRMVATAMLCRYRTLPDEVEESGEGAVLCNVYTLPEYRGQGIMETLLRMLIRKGREAGIREIILNAEDKAISLYRRLGFAQMSGAMVLSLK